MKFKMILSACVLFSWQPSSLAQVDYGHNPPVGPALAEFAADFPELRDSEWDIPLGGFGGQARGAPSAHVPVIFVHGNNVDACDWKLVRDDFLAAGWTEQSLWALSYNGLGNDVGNYSLRADQRCRDEHAERNGGDSVSRITANDINVPDLHAFIVAVQAYTGSPAFSLVAHSLGVTVARKTLQVYPELREHVVAFVGIAGGNHGTSLCPAGSALALYGCNELTPGSDWLADLNGPDAEDESYAPAAWITVYDGTGTGDGTFAPPDQQSPRLDGADNREYPGVAHNGLRVEAAIVAEYREFLEQAEQARMGSGQMAEKGGGVMGYGTMLLVGLLMLMRRGYKASLLCLLYMNTVHAAALSPPLTAPAAFPADFSVPMDAELKIPLGGFGGESGTVPSHVPVIFVHGNTGDACNWFLVRDDFKAAGWNDQALWALSYHGLGGDKGDAPGRPDPRCAQQIQDRGGDGLSRITSNDINVPDVYAFIRAVKNYTGSQSFAIVAHSLGVTLARRTLQLHPELRDSLVAFVGIAGGNHGTSLCPPGSEKYALVCAEVAAVGSNWLAQLNGPDGADETWSAARWMTIYDGSGSGDLAFTGTTATSPVLKGADNRAFSGVSHNDLRVAPDIVAIYRQFLEQASVEAKAARHRAQIRRKLIGR